MFHLASVVVLLLLTYQFVVQATNSQSILPRDGTSSNCIDSCSPRTSFNIIWGCLSTTIICAWAAIHPNIPPHEGPFKGTLRRLELMFWTIVAPEILPAWALNQRLAAMTVRDVYNEGRGYKPTRYGIWKTLKEYFALSEIKGVVNPAWSLKHGHFLIMGGIHVVEPVDNSASLGPATDEVVNVEARDTLKADMEKGGAPSEDPPEPEEGRVTILTLEMLRELVKDKEFKIQLTAAEIANRSKGDALSKAIFVLQTSWFIIQCIARRVQGLDLTQLELTTLALASLNGITFIFWWDKPLGAQTIVRVYMKRKLTDAERNAQERGHSARSELIDDIPGWFEVSLTTIRDIFLRRTERNIFEDCLVRLPLAIITLLFFPFVAFTIAFFFNIYDLIMGGSTSFPADATHVPTFYVPIHEHSNSGFDIFIFLTLGTIFGAIHCAGWNFFFPTYPEQKLWRVASLAVTTIPFGFIILLIVVSVDPQQNMVRKIISNVAQLFAIISVLAYACARLVLLGQAVALLRHPPPAAFATIDWSKFYPHFF